MNAVYVSSHTGTVTYPFALQATVAVFFVLLNSSGGLGHLLSICKLSPVVRTLVCVLL
jgi:hypothetical protein